MAFTFDSTVKSSTGNSYVSVSEADDYFGGHLQYDLWNDKTNEEKQRFLVSATTRLDMEQWTGKKTTVAQRLQWPREYVESRDADYLDTVNERIDFLNDGTSPTYYINKDTIPNELKQATYETAIWFIVRQDLDPHLIDEYNQEALTSFEMGPLKGNIKSGLTVDRLPTPVKRLLNAMSPSAWKGGQQSKLVRG